MMNKIAINGIQHSTSAVAFKASMLQQTADASCAPLELATSLTPSPMDSAPAIRPRTTPGTLLLLPVSASLTIFLQLQKPA